MGPRSRILHLLLVAKLRLLLEELTDTINVERFRDDEIEILAVTMDEKPGRSAVIAINLGRSRPCNSLLAIVATPKTVHLGKMKIQ